MRTQGLLRESAAEQAHGRDAGCPETAELRTKSYNSYSLSTYYLPDPVLSPCPAFSPVNSYYTTLGEVSSLPFYQRAKA